MYYLLFSILLFSMKCFLKYKKECCLWGSMFYSAISKCSFLVYIQILLSKYLFFLFSLFFPPRCPLLVPLTRYRLSDSSVELSRWGKPARLSCAAVWDPDCCLPQSVCSRHDHSLLQRAVSHHGTPTQQQALGDSVWRRRSNPCHRKTQQSNKDAPTRWFIWRM